MTESHKEQSLLFQALGRIAAATGTESNALYDEYREGVQTSEYPGPYCLHPNEVEICAREGTLPGARMAHVAVCHTCTGLLLTAAQHDPAGESRLRDEVRKLLAEERSPVEVAAGV